MKKPFVLLVIIVLVCSMTACPFSGSNDRDRDDDRDEKDDSSEESISLFERLGESAGDMTTSSPSYEPQINTEWPNEMPNSVPQPDEMTIVSNYVYQQTVQVMFTGMHLDYAELYVLDMEKKGWTITKSTSDETSIVAKGQIGDNEFLQFTYNVETEEGMIVYNKIE